MRLFRKSSSTRKSLELKNRLGIIAKKINKPTKNIISIMVKYEPPIDLVYHIIR